MLTAAEAREYLLLLAEHAADTQKPLPHAYAERADAERTYKARIKRINFLIKKAGAKNLSDMHRIVSGAMVAAAARPKLRKARAVNSKPAKRRK